MNCSTASPFPQFYEHHIKSNSADFRAEMRSAMIMNPGMLLFGLVDSGIAFFLVFYICRARFGGVKSTIARTIGAVLGTIVFIIYFGVIVWFNTNVYTVTEAVKLTVYLAPIVLSVLMTILVILSQPPKKKDEEEEELSEESEDNEKEAAS